MENKMLSAKNRAWCRCAFSSDTNDSISPLTRSILCCWRRRRISQVFLFSRTNCTASYDLYKRTMLLKISSSMKIFSSMANLYNKNKLVRDLYNRFNKQKTLLRTRYILKHQYFILFVTGITHSSRAFPAQKPIWFWLEHCHIR